MNTTNNSLHANNRRKSRAKPSAETPTMPSTSPLAHTTAQPSWKDSRTSVPNLPSPSTSSTSPADTGLANSKQSQQSSFEGSRSLRSTHSARRGPMNDSVLEIKGSPKGSHSSDSLVTPDSGVARSESEGGGHYDDTTGND